jgi:hypothetical protein
MLCQINNGSAAAQAVHPTAVEPFEDASLHRVNSASRTVIALFALACARPYVPAGAKNLAVSGTYDVGVSLFTTTCRGISVRDADVVVDHAPGATAAKITYEGLPFDARIALDGRFTTATTPFRLSGVTGTAWITGRFTDSTVQARVHGRSARGDCEYQLRWIGRRY